MAIEYAAIVVTPDAIRDGLVELILTDLQCAAPMQIIWRKEWRIVSMDTVFSMYPRIVGRPSCAPVIRTLMAGSCLVMVVLGENLYLKLREVKGRIRFNEDFSEVVVSGLRLKYRTWLPEELELLKENSGSPHREAILNKIYEYRIHTTDDLRETAYTCCLCMTDDEMAELKDIAPSLHEEVIRLKSEMI